MTTEPPLGVHLLHARRKLVSRRTVYVRAGAVRHASLFLAEAVVPAVALFGMLIPPLGWLPPALDSFGELHLARKLERLSGGVKLGWASVPE